MTGTGQIGRVIPRRQSRFPLGNACGAPGVSRGASSSPHTGSLGGIRRASSPRSDRPHLSSHGPRRVSNPRSFSGKRRRCVFRRGGNLSLEQWNSISKFETLMGKFPCEVHLEYSRKTLFFSKDFSAILDFRLQALLRDPHLLKLEANKRNWFENSSSDPDHEI